MTDAQSKQDSAAYADRQMEVNDMNYQNNYLASSQKLTALYSRLSREDGDNTESCSIATQKRILEEYAKNNGLTPYQHWVDDGVSGKNFMRPGFQEMLAEIEAGRVGTICVKNLDRFGRSYLESGLYREKFRQLGVRFIAVGDNVDSAAGDDAFTPFREVINEFYLSEYSKKIKAAFRSRGMVGKHTSSFCPYGYYKSPEDKNQWLVDEYAAGIVQRIFQMTIDGMGPYQICCALEAERVKTPGAYLAKKGSGLHQSHAFDNPYHWTSNTITSMLKKKEYLGHTVNFKSKKDSYKDKRSTYVPEDEWVIFENTHEAIIDQETYDTVQRIRSKAKRRPDGWGYTHPLTGLLYCADCGAKLYVQRINNGKPKPYYTCYNYRKVPVGVDCKTPHRIDADTVMELLKTSLGDIIKFAITNRKAFEKLVCEKLSKKQSGEIESQKKRLAICNKRLKELEILYRKIYEDNALGKLPDKQFSMMSESYAAEQDALEKEVAKLQSADDKYTDSSERADQFIKLVGKYIDFDELSTSALNELVDKIVVHERDRKGSAQTTQRIDIYLTFIGNFELPKQEIDPAVLAAREEENRKIQERKDRLHQNYLRRKANGKQAEYERKYDPLRRARMEERKAAAREEVAALAVGEGKVQIWPYMNIAQ